MNNISEKPHVVLVHTELTSDVAACEDLSELKLLAISANYEISDILVCRRGTPQPRFFIGSGKVEELKDMVLCTESKLVIFNNHLSPAQERNIEKEIGCPVIERTALILEIFAQRARTYEGKLQVELAQLKYQSTRLVRGWTHLERQKGGFGLRGGPGEKQLELDRRMLHNRIDEIGRELDRVALQREQSRKARKKNEIPVLALVGYTNAGKSSLFNYLTGSNVYSADQLFATLDPTLRTIEINNLGKVIFADTVGFIRHLPHDLVAAFKATLQETRDATLLLHVIDASDDRRDDNIEQVNNVLEEIGAQNVQVLKVYNKIDLLEQVVPHVEYDEFGVPTGVWISAKTGDGSQTLKEIISKILQKNIVKFIIQLPVEYAKVRSEFYAVHGVVEESYDEYGNSILKIEIPESDYNRINKKFNYQLSNFIKEE